MQPQQPQQPEIQAGQQPNVPPGPPSQPQQPQQPDPSRAQPGQGDDFTQPGKSNEQANLNPDEKNNPIEPQLGDDAEDEDMDLDDDVEEDEQDDATSN